MLLVAAMAAEKDAPGARGFTPKLTAPIGISWELARPVREGEPLGITLTVTPEEALTRAAVSLVAPDALTLIEPVAGVELGALAHGESAEITVTVVPLAGGTHYLHVSVTGTLRGQAQTRSIAVPIRVAGGPPTKSADNTAGKRGESVRSFRALETVR